MSIASRITAMQEHLRDDYSVLTLAGADLTNVDKNIVNLKPTWKERLLYFMNNGTDEVWENWDKVTGEGTSLTLNNTLEAKMGIELKGNTYQEGTPTPDSPVPIQVVSGDNSIDVCGKNLLDNTKIVKGRLDNGVIGYATGTTSLSVTDTSISFTTNNNYRGVTSDFIKRKSGEFIMIQATYDNNNLTASSIAFYDKDKNYIGGKAVAIQTYGWRAYNAGDDIANAEYIRFWFSLNTAGSVTITNPMVEFGTEPSTYEPYKGASYPINLGVENLFDFSNTTISTLGNVGTTTVQDDKVIFTANSSVYGVQFDIKNLVEKNTTYTISNLMSSTQTLTGNGNGWRYYDGSSYTTMGGYQTQFTFTTGTGTTHILYYYVGTPSQYNGTLTLDKIQLEIGSKANSYSPFGQTPIQLLHIPNTNYYDKIDKSSGKNSFNPQDFITAVSTHYQETKTINGIEFICLGREGSTTVTYTYELNCKENTQYTLSMKYTNSNCSMQFKYSDGTNSSTFPTATSTITDYSITSASNKTITGIIVNCYGWYSTGSKLEIAQIMLNEGTTALEYEPYGTGWYVKKEIGKVVLDGSETWVLNESGTGYVRFTTTESDLISSFDNTKKYVMSDKFLSSSQFETVNANADKNRVCVVSNNRLLFKTLDTSLSTAQLWKTWLSTNNVEVRYVLATPTYTEIEDSTLISQLETIKKSYEGQTNITQENNDLASILNATALREMS